MAKHLIFREKEREREKREGEIVKARPAFVLT
jgi:hypothetical protein